MNPLNVPTFDNTPVFTSTEADAIRFKLSLWERLAPNRAIYREKNKHAVIVHTSERPVPITHHDQFLHNDGDYLRAGDIQIIPSGSEVSCAWGQRLSFLKMEIGQNMLNEAGWIAGFQPSDAITLVRTYPVQDHKLLQMITWLHEEMLHGGPGGSMYQESLVRLVLIHLIRQYSSSSAFRIEPSARSGDCITEAVRYMQERLEDDISITQLAEAANMSVSHFIRSFKRSLGMTPRQYFIRLRLEQAKFLLRQGSIPLKDIAARTGFSDQAHFSNMFKQATGFTPREYAALK